MELKHTAERAGRLSSFLREEMRLSAGLMNRLKWKDLILVNGVPQHTDYAVQPGDVITACLEEPEPQYDAEEGKLTVLYEDDHFLAVEKPAGILIHPSHCQNSGTLANLVVGYYRKNGQKSAFHPITRLDRDTFGIVLLAKNSHAHALMTALQEKGAIRKTYHALVFGGPEQDAGVIDAPIVRKPLPSLLREVRADGKPSTTEFTVLERLENCTLLALRPVTGRTHQLRVHCAYRGFPILGDPQYGSEASRAFSEKLGLPHQLLCAKSLEFVHPITGQRLLLESRLEVKSFLKTPFPC